MSKQQRTRILITALSGLIILLGALYTDRFKIAYLALALVWFIVAGIVIALGVRERRGQ
ncbi:hypothetical protein [Arthrobacter sp. ERGS1:01]|uniref:hypothetical protein n=1 Tax=Arthrobacter sp. ERGS1:01 TaxID=1704044 RepID=UPI000A9CE14C|nr:hypothetical protein [Arthrobacter sp. ERGS1:01]